MSTFSLSVETNQEVADPPLVVGRPNLVDAEGFTEDMRQILESRLFTNHGPFEKQLEATVEQYLGVRHAVAVCNATLGLELALRALELPHGGEVIMPAYTFAASAHAVHAVGLTPVFADCDPETHLIDLASAARCAERGRAVALLCVHLWGAACDADACEAFARAHGLELVFDAAHGFGSRYAGTGTDGGGGTRVGTCGTAEVFSLHATKLLNSFEGGIVTTDNDTIAARVRAARQFGIAGQDYYTRWGTNAKLSEPSAALALRHLRHIEGTLDAYRERAHWYNCELRARGLVGGACAGLELWNASRLGDAACTHAYVCVRVRRQHLGLSRNQLMNALRARGVYAKRYFFPGCHRIAPYARETTGSADGDPATRDPTAVPLPCTEALCESVLVLPTGTCVTEADVAFVARAMASARDAAAAKDSPRVDEAVHEIDMTAMREQLRTIEAQKAALAEKMLILQDREKAIASALVDADNLVKGTIHVDEEH